MNTLAAILIVTWAVIGCNAIIGHTTVVVKDKPIIEIESFGYKQGGLLTFKTDVVEVSNVTFYFCTEREYEVIYPQQGDDERLCNGMPICEITQHPLNEPINQYSVRTTNAYHLLLIDCDKQGRMNVEVNYVLVNPGNKHLSLGYIPLPNIYTFLSIAWFSVILASALYWLKNKRHLVIFHGLLGAVGILKFIVVIVALSYWSSFQRDGKPIVQLAYLQSFLFALSETAFFCALLLVSKGWRITRSTLPPSEIRTISVALVLLLSTLLFFSYYSDGYYFLSLMIMYFFMLPKIFTSITRNTRALQTQMLLMRYANTETSIEPLLVKMQMFKTMRTAVILYLGSILLVSSMRIIMLWYLLWVNNCLSELIALLMVVIVSILLRPRENGAFSTRAFLEGNPFPILNMQNMDHFDELFGDQLLDPDLVIMNAGLRENVLLDGAEIDMNNIIVVEYPSPPVVNSMGKLTHYPRLALGNAVKPPPATDSIILNNNNTTTNNNNNNGDLTRSNSSSSSSSNSVHIISIPSQPSSLPTTPRSLLSSSSDDGRSLPL